MSLEQFYYRVEDCVRGVGRYLLNQPLRGRAADPLAALLAERDDHSGRLAKALRELAATRRARAERRDRAAFLRTQIEALVKLRKSDAAYALAMEMDEVRRALAADDARLPRQEQVCWSLEFKLRQLERQITREQQRRGAAKA